MKGTTDLPSPECYYNYFNSGFVGGKDMLTLRLYGRHIEILEGSPHYFGWICAGYQRNNLVEQQADKRNVTWLDEDAMQPSLQVKR